MPTDVLFRIPEWAVYVDLDDGPIYPAAESIRLLGFITHLEYDDELDRSELRFLALLKVSDPRCPPVSLWRPTLLPLNVATIEQAHEIVDRESDDTFGEEVLGDQVSAKQQSRWLIDQMLPLILYLCSDSSEVNRRNHLDQRPEPARPVNVRGRLHLVDPGGPAWWEVGYRIGRQLREAGESAEAEVGGRGLPPAPHLRRAHWHLYWTGPRTGTQEPRVRWLAPILVGDRGGRELPPTIKRVSSPSD